MKSIKEINKTLDYLDRNMFATTSQAVIKLFRSRLKRLDDDDEKEIISRFSIQMFVDALPYIVYSLNFFNENTVNFPIKFQQDLVFRYLINYEQIITSTEDIFVSRKESNIWKYDFESSKKASFS